MEVLDNYSDKLKNFREAISEQKTEQINEMIVNANRIKKIL